MLLTEYDYLRFRVIVLAGQDATCTMLAIKQMIKLSETIGNEHNFLNTHTCPTVHPIFSH